MVVGRVQVIRASRDECVANDGGALFVLLSHDVTYSVVTSLLFLMETSLSI